MSDPHARLARQIATLAGPDAAIEAAESRPWMALTFSGARHRFVLRLAPARAARLAATIGTHDFALGGHFVADITGAIGADGASLTIDALTIAAA